MNLSGKKILIGITGSIAAYKTILLVRLLVKAGADVKVVMTPAAADFVSPVVLSTLSKNPVLRDIASADTWSNHVMLGRWADLMVVAPASCNTISKMATGVCDNLLLAVYLSATCPVWIAPAMDEDMWKHPSTRRNLDSLRSFGNFVMQVGQGELASGLVGEGRMAEPEDIFATINDHFEPDLKPLKGLKALVTAGPTHEPLDPVRFIGNHSSGLMGVEIATALQKAGADVHLILGPSKMVVPDSIKLTRVITALEMFEVTKQSFSNCQVAVMSAAVADYRPSEVASQKIKKEGGDMTIHLTPNPDILRYCGENKSSGQLVAGFALETENEEQNARKKLENKKADIIVLNSLRDADAGFGTTTNKITIFEKSGAVHRLPLMTKTNAAKKIVEVIAAKYHETNQ